ncbi:MAG: GUN4 domain-containing protein [Brasilonema octagenarum HA4186-MV1]|nr:GUN4 domain-containing protein [Brasilonema octagenarum HA4186-MV1]
MFSTLLNFDYLDIRTAESGIQETINDYSYLDNSNIVESLDYNHQTASALKLVLQALQQSAHIIEADRSQLPGQLLARLPHDNPELSGLLFGLVTQEGVRKGAIEQNLYPWLKPLNISLNNSPQLKQKTIVTNHNGELNAIALSGDGKTLISLKDHILKVWDVTSGELRHTLSVQPLWHYDEESKQDVMYRSQVSAIAVGVDGKWAASGLDILDAKMESFVDIWDLEQGVFVRRFPMGANDICSLAISLSGRHVVTGFESGLFRVSLIDQHFRGMRSADLKNIVFQQYHRADACTISPNGRWAITTTGSEILIWDLLRGQLIQAFRFQSNSSIKALSLNFEGAIVATFVNGEVQTWDLNLSLANDDLLVSDIRKLALRNLKIFEPFRVYRANLHAFTSIVRGSDKLLKFLAWCAHSRKKRAVATNVIFFLEQTIHRIFELLRLGVRDEDKILLSDLPFVWKSLRVFSSIKPRHKLYSIPLDGISINGLTGVYKTPTGDIEVLNLGATSLEKLPNSTKRQAAKEVAISIDGRFVFFLIGDNKLKMRDVAGVLPPTLLRQKKPSKLAAIFNRKGAIAHVDRVAKSLGGHWLLLITKKSYKLIDLAKDNSQTSLPSWQIRDVSPNGEWALWQSSSKTLRVTSLKTGEVAGHLYDYYEDLAKAGEFENNDPQGAKQVWYLQPQRHQALNYQFACINNTGDTVLIFNDGFFDSWLWHPFYYLTQWDVRNGSISKTLSRYQTPKFKIERGEKSLKQKWVISINAIALYRGGTKGLFGLKDGTIKVCNLATGQELFSIDGHKMMITALSVSSDEQWAVSCAADCTVKFWHLPSCSEVTSFTFDDALYSSKLVEVTPYRMLAVLNDEFSRVHTLELVLPTDYRLPAKAVELVEEVIEDEDLTQLISQETIGIPVPIERLKDLPIELNSDAEIDFTHLQELLRKNQWQQANTETKKLVLKALNKEPNYNKILTPADIEIFPSADLLTVDRLWLKYSAGRYGLSLQMRVWEKFRDSDIAFYRSIGQRFWDKLFQCETPQERHGHFPYVPLIYLSPESLEAFFIKMAQVSGYPHIGSKINFENIDVLDNELTIQRNFLEPSDETTTPIIVDYSQETSSGAIELSDDFLSNLDSLLSSGSLWEATSRTMLRILGNNDDDTELIAADKIWQESTNGKYGFTSQKMIWEECDRDFVMFCYRVGWLSNDNPGTLSKILFSYSSPEGHLPVMELEEFTFEDGLNFNRSVFERIFNRIDNIYPSTRPHKVHLWGFPKATASFLMQVRGTGIVELKTYLDGRLNGSSRWVYEEDSSQNKQDSPEDCERITFPLPSFVSNFRGSLTLKPLSDDYINPPHAFVTIEFSSVVGLHNFEKYTTLLDIQRDGVDIQEIVKIQKEFLGDYHLNILNTLTDFVKQQTEIDSDFVEDYCIKQIEEIYRNLQRVEVGNEAFGFVLYLTPDHISKKEKFRGSE